MAIDPRDPEFLLERSERVRALARHLLGMADGAEDVAQDALVASLDRQDQGDGPLPARLAASVRSLAGRWRRAKARRARREAAAARPDRAPSTAELVERAALQRTLVEAVLALDEPYRESVILRYFEGLPPRAIAELRSLPVRTVQTRLARALALLRARLQRRVDLSAWVPLLLPVAARPSDSLPDPSSVLGALTMANSKLLLGAAAVIAVSATVFVLGRSGRPADPDPLSQRAPTPKGDLAAVAESPLDRSLEDPALERRSAESTQRSETTADTVTWMADRELDLFGEVVDGTGLPLEGVSLSAFEPQLAPDRSACVASEGGIVLAGTLSDEQGRFKLRLERGQHCTLEASLPGMASVRLPERRAGERVRIELGPAALLWGWVTRVSDGSAVAQALVRLRQRPLQFSVSLVCFEVTTDEEGAYAFAALPAGAYDVWVSCPSDPDPPSSTLVLTPGRTEQRDFLVPAGLDVAGRVVDALTGSAIANAEVSFDPFFAESSLTAADGTFLLRGWDPRERGRTVNARAAGYASAFRALLHGGETPLALEIALGPAAAITGRILSPTGAPQADARIEVYGHRDLPDALRDRASTRSGPDGRFSVTGLSREQSQTLVAIAPGAGRLIVDLPDFDPAQDPRDLGDLDLPVAASLAGRVVDSSGRAIPQAFVRLHGGDAGRNRLRARELASPPAVQVTPPITLRLDDLGRFMALDLAAGDYSVTAEVTGGAGQAESSVHLREGERKEGLELVLDLGWTIAGRVVGPDGEPVALASIIAMPSSGGFEGWTSMLSRPDGSFELSGLSQGEWDVSVELFQSTDSRRYCGARIQRVAAGTADLRIRLPEAAEISGVVLGSDGLPLPAATVQMDHGDGRVGGMGAVSCDAHGRFRLLVPAGVPVDLLAADWRARTEGAAAVKLGRIRGVEPGTLDLTMRIDP
jgi:RNA polymerase sigma factor (sigma-70 family)